jgi:hypothetical protein
MIPSLSAWHGAPCGVYGKASSHLVALNNHRGARVCDLLNCKPRTAFFAKTHFVLLFARPDALPSFLGGLLAIPPLLLHVGLKFLRGKRCCFSFWFPDAWQQNQLTLCFGMACTNTLDVCCGRL